MELTPMQTLLSNFGAVVTGVTGFIGDIVGAVIGQPLLLIPIGLGLLGVGIGLVKKFM